MLEKLWFNVNSEATLSHKIFSLLEASSDNLSVILFFSNLFFIEEETTKTFSEYCILLFTFKLNFMNINKTPIIIIAGPTASGKTSFSIQLAKLINGEIINADAMQLYNGFNILKATPSKNEMNGIEHHLFGSIDIDKKISVADWLKYTEEKIFEIQLKKKVPIIVGGSGMYINSALNGISNIPKISYEVKNKVINIFNQKGIDFVYEKLKISNNSIFEIQKNDKQRLIRAYEVFLQTGKPISWWQKKKTKQPIIKNSYKILIFPKKEDLYPQIDKRLKKMIDIGLLKEVKKHYSQNLSLELPSMKAIGIKFFFEHLSGKRNLEDAICLTQQESRRYAKRQMTWFRNSFSYDIIYEKLFEDDKKFVFNVLKALNLL